MEIYRRNFLLCYLDNACNLLCKCKRLNTKESFYHIFYIFLWSPLSELRMHENWKGITMQRDVTWKVECVVEIFWRVISKVPVIVNANVRGWIRKNRSIVFFYIFSMDYLKECRWLANLFLVSSKNAIDELVGPR